MSRSIFISGIRRWARLCLSMILAVALVATAGTLASPANAQNVEVALSSRIEVNGLPYSGDVAVKVAIVDTAVTSLWSNDNSSVGGSEPSSFFTVSVTDSVFTLNLGSGDTAVLPGSIFDGTSPLFVILWMDAGEGLQRFDPLPLTTVPRAVSALRLGGRPASDYLTNSSSIATDNLQAFSDSGNILTLGDGAALSDKELRVATGAADEPVLRYNIATSSWQFSNDGVTYLELDNSSATSFIGAGSLTTAVDLNTGETAGILPIAKGGTGSETAAQARTALGLEIDADVLAFKLNNFSANVAPSATDDSSFGYSIGSVWIDTLAAQSYIAVDVSLGAAIWQATSFVPNNSVTSASVADDTLTDADISSSAAVSHAKLAPAAPGAVLLGNAASVVTATTVSGDISIDSSGATTITDGAVTGSKIGISGQTQGDVLYFDGSAWSRLSPGSAGSVLTSTGVGADPVWAVQGGQFAPHPITNRRLAWSFPVATNSTAFTSVGMSNPTVTAAGTAQPALPGATRMYIRYATTATVNNTNGIRGPLTQTRPTFRPTYSTVIRTDSSVASRRIWIGLSSAELAALSTNTLGTPSSTASFVAIAYDTTGTGNTTDWLCCSGDSASYSCITTGVSVAIETEYTMVVDWATLGSLTCSVNGTSVSKLSNLSTATVNIGPYSSVRTLSAAIANHFIAKQGLEQN